MTPSTKDRTDLFFRFWRQHLIALLVVVVVLGATALGLMLSSRGAVGNPRALAWWLMPIVLALVVAMPMSLRRRRWNPDSPDVKAVENDEWRRVNMNRASRAALIVVLAAQWPLGLMLGFVGELPPPRAAMAMAASTTTIGLVTLIALFLFFDREPSDG